MSRTTIDFGIDLGTTNSAVALLKGVSTEIIQNNDHQDVTRSAVSIDRHGNVLTGFRAANMIAGASRRDVHIEFKRRMGTNYSYLFESSGMRKLPEELSAEILSQLKGDAQARTGEEIEAVVITVPAAFELHQIDATNTAAKLAGFKQSPLLQEPIAAALAHGFQAGKPRVYWLVYDFGGGTFDAAIIKADSGTIHVVNHGGDNVLGGSDIDWAIADHLVVPQLLREWKLKDFTRANSVWHTAFAKIKNACEGLKIELSRRDQATLQVEFSRDTDTVIDFDCTIKRSAVVSVAEPFIRRSIEICRKIMRDSSLDKSAFEKVILVGGPVLAPYFREMLAVELGILLDFSVDPLTVVARGAAVFAGSQKLARSTPVGLVGEFRIEMMGNPIGAASEPLVGGKIYGDAATDFSKLTIEFVRTKTGWRSGKISVSVSGGFETRLHAEIGVKNIFRIELLGASGIRLKVNPEEYGYTIGAVVAEQALTNSIGIALADNKYDRLFDKGRGLPLEARRTYKTVTTIHKGVTSETIRIPIIEGEFVIADMNRHIDTLELVCETGGRDLPAGSEVEVQLKIDESRLITVDAFVPILNMDFSKVIELRRTDVDSRVLIEQFSHLRKRLNDLEGKVEQEKLVGLQEQVGILVPLVAASGGDVDAAAKADKLLLEFRNSLEVYERDEEFPLLIEEVRTNLRQLKDLVHELGSEYQKRRFEELRELCEHLILGGKTVRLRMEGSHVEQLIAELVAGIPGFWSNMFLNVLQKETEMSDGGRAKTLIRQGRKFNNDGNEVGLKNVVLELWGLLPKETPHGPAGGFRSGLVK